MANVGIGVTIGSHSLRGVKVKKSGASFVVLRAFADRIDDTVRPVAGRALAAKGVSGATASVGLTGRDVIIRYSQIPPVPEWRLKNLMKFEVEEVGSQSGGDVSADYRKLNLPDPEGTRGEDTILVALARNRHLEALLGSLASGGITPEGGCPNSVALFNAFAVNATYTEEETCLLVNIGAQNLDLAIQKGGELLFARNATPGGKAFTDALVGAFSTTEGKAEQMKLAKADVTPKGQARYADSTAEKVANALIGVAGQLASLIQSTLMIARAQAKLPDLKVDRVVLAGGGASLKGLDLYLKQAMGVPVERLNPFAISDLSQMPADEREMLEAAPHEFAVVMGLAQARMAPAAFRLSVLPAALRKKREFLTKGIYGVAAGVIGIVGTLAVLHMKLASADSEGRKQHEALRRQADTARALDDNLRKALAANQEETVKARVLADVASTDDLLARTFQMLERALTKDIYLYGVQLKVQEPSNEFVFLKPKSDKEKASGYEGTPRKKLFRRNASVLVQGRISGGQRPAAVYQKFVQDCQANGLGLAVKPSGALRQGGPAGQDASFEMEVYSGLVVALVTEEGSQARSVLLRNPDLDDKTNPTKIVGVDADGSPIEIPLDAVHRDGKKEMIEDLQSRAADAAAPPAGPKKPDAPK